MSAASRARELAPVREEQEHLPLRSDARERGQPRAYAALEIGARRGDRVGIRIVQGVFEGEEILGHRNQEHRSALGRDKRERNPAAIGAAA